MRKRHDSAPRARVLAFESLENRELLSINPVLTTADAVETRNAEIRAAVESFEPIQFVLPIDQVGDVSNARIEGDTLVELSQPKIERSSSDATTITIQWTEESMAADYQILYRKKSEKTYSSFVVNNPELPIATIENLTPNTSYYVSVVALSANAQILSSSDACYKTIKTKSPVTLSQPTITSSVSDLRSIALEWNVVNNAVGYSVTCFPKGVADGISFTVGDDTTSFNIGNLTPGVSYTVKVVALGDGIGTKDSKAASKTLATTPLTTLTQPKITSFEVDKRTVTIEWENVDKFANAERELRSVDAYQVFYRSTTTSEAGSFYVSASQTKTTIDALTPGTSYKVRVVAIGNGYTTKDSKDALFTTITTAPLVTLAQPKITAIEGRLRSINLEWSASDAASGYLVAYRATNTSGYSYLTVDSGSTSCLISYLTPGTSYQVKVVALGDGVDTQDSKESAVKKITTKQVVTLKQPKITSFETDKRSITIEWEDVDGFSNDGPKRLSNVYAYEIFYSSPTTNESGSHVVMPYQTATVIEGLTPGTSYNVWVVALGNGRSTKNSKDTATKKITTAPLVTLAQPTITYSASDLRSLYVEWDAVSRAKGYLVSYRAANSKTSFYSSSVGTNATLDALTPGTSYIVKVVALGDGWDTKDSKDTAYKKIATNPIVTLAQPTIKSSVVEQYLIDVSWNAVDGANGYKVIWTETKSNETQVCYLAHDSTEFAIKGLAPKTTYRVKVVALGDGNGTTDSKATAYKTYTTKALTTLVKPVITSLQTTQSTLKVNWNADDAASAFVLYYKKSGASEEQSLYLNGGKTSCVLKDLEEGAGYSVRVVAIGDGYWTLDSPSSATKTIALSKIPKISAPEINGVNPTAVTAKIEFDRQENAAYYEVVYRKTGSSATTKLVFLANDDIVLKGLNPNQSYGVKIRALAHDFLADSDYCQETTFKTAVQTKLATPAAPTATSYQHDEYAALTVRWAPVENALYYEIEYKDADGKSGSEFTGGPYTVMDVLDLKLGAKYELRVRAVGDDDYFVTSEFSSLLTAVTVEP